MGFSDETIKKAFEIKNQEVKKANFIYDNSLANAKEQFPRINEIEVSLSVIGTSIISFAMKGDQKALKEAQKKAEELTKEKEELLKKGGVKPRKHFCKKCQDTGYLSGKLCTCIKNLARDIALDELNKAMPLDSVGFDKFSLEYYPDKSREKMEEIFALCLDYVDNFDGKKSKNLLFSGKTGLGKTHLSLSIVKELTKKGINVIYGSAQNLFSAAEKEHFSYSGERQTHDALIEAELLVIDDLGTEFMTPYVQSLFYEIINTRLLQSKPTIINTNLNFGELEIRYTPRITSRFIGDYLVRYFSGEDIRALKRLENS